MVMREAKPFDLDVCTKCENVFRRPDPKTVTLMCIRPEIRTVFRLPNGKTMLTRKGAYSRYAWLAIRGKYPCNGDCTSDDPYPRPTCKRDHYDGDSEKLHTRLVRWLMWRDKTMRTSTARRARGGT